MKRFAESMDRGQSTLFLNAWKIGFARIIRLGDGLQPRSGPIVIALGNFGYQSVAAVPATVLAPRVQGLGRVEVGENGFVIDRDFGDPFGIAANQIFGAGV